MCFTCLVDIDECQDSPDCADICTNIPGGYTCGCQAGLTLASDQKSCIGKSEFLFNV